MTEHVTSAFVAMLLGLASAPFGPFPWMRNLNFEPGLFLVSAVLAAVVLAVTGAGEP